MRHLRTFVSVTLFGLGVVSAGHASVGAAPPEDLSEIKTKMIAAQTGDPEKKPGALVYREHCSQCNEGQAQKAPIKTFLSMMTPEAIYDALAIGIMRPMAVRLTDEQKHHVAEYLSGSPVGMAKVAIAPTCSSDAVMAFDLQTGKIRWSWQVVPCDAWNVGCMIGLDTCPEPAGPDFDIGPGTMLVTCPTARTASSWASRAGRPWRLTPTRRRKACCGRTAWVVARSRVAFSSA